MNSSPKREHVPVMEDECLKFFSDVKLKVFFEGTLGAGGHAKAILDGLAHGLEIGYVAVCHGILRQRLDGVALNPVCSLARLFNFNHLYGG